MLATVFSITWFSHCVVADEHCVDGKLEGNAFSANVSTVLAIKLLFTPNFFY